MPPRYAYWTILIDQKPTAFRSREREELLPTFHQLGRKNTDVVMKWFARGKLWDSPEEAQAAQRAPKPPFEKRGHAWRPGGEHRDPRERFKKSSQPRAAGRATWVDREKPGAPSGSRPWAGKPPAGPPRGGRPWGSQPSGDRPRGATGKPRPFASRAGNDQRKPWQRDRPGKRPDSEAAKRTSERPGQPPSERIRTKPKPPEKG